MMYGEVLLLAHDNMTLDVWTTQSYLGGFIIIFLRHALQKSDCKLCIAKSILVGDVVTVGDVDSLAISVTSDCWSFMKKKMSPRNCEMRQFIRRTRKY